MTLFISFIALIVVIGFFFNRKQKAEVVTKIVTVEEPLFNDHEIKKPVKGTQIHDNPYQYDPVKRHIKRILPFVAILCLVGIAYAADTVYNPFTGKLDYVAVPGTGGPVTNSVFRAYTSTHSGAATVTAGQVTNTPFGNISSVTVQGAVNELESSKAPSEMTVYDAGTCTTTVAIDPANGEEQTLTLGGNCTATIALSASGKSRKLFLRVAQGASPYTLALQYTGGTPVKWPGGSANVQSTGAGQVDDIACRVYDTIAHCAASQNMQ